MKALKSWLLVSALFAGLIGTTAFAGDVSEPNIFHADLMHPDLALAVSAFEKTCMPFVLHKTEMTRETDKRHMAKLMTSRGFVFQTSVEETKRFLIEPKHMPWKPAPDDRERFKGIYAHNERQNGKPKTTHGQFTVFNGVSSQVVPSGKTIVTRPGEIMGVQIPAKYRTALIETETYDDLNEPRLSAHLGWNYPSQNHPGKQCEISFERSAISRENFVKSFIAKDADWKAVPDTQQPDTQQPDTQQSDTVSWSQCFIDGEDEFQFTASRTPQALSISMTRNDFYQPKLCFDTG